MINWGILGLGRMGMTFANAIQETSNSNLTRIASKSGKTFQKFENSTYENLIKDKNIDAIYISTLNNTHIDLINEISKEGKKILCEKPISLSLEKLIEIKDLMFKKNIRLYEAIAYYSHPQTLELLKLIDNDEIGEIKKVESNFGFKTKFKPSSRLFDKSLGGGSIFDLGCYPISFLMLLSKDASRISIESKTLNYATNGVDDDATAILNCNNKFRGNIHVSLKSHLDNTCTIYGTKGHIKLKDPWLPNLKSEIEVLSNNNHFYLKTINSKLSIYANQIQNISESFANPNKKFDFFDIEKSLINMKLINKWLN
ncbi:Gfo/Idh/MocA family oxidoreductase [Candidatus Pelagibacter sp.]|nr:Gfo/Idh/MocA family oxidoreductase [Candidatus Pelagibacter sp.]